MKYFYIIVFNKNTLLHAVCKFDNLHLVKYLVEKGLDINSENTDNFTPFLLACDRSNKRIIKYLIDEGADVTKTNCDQFTYIIFYFLIKNCLQLCALNKKFSFNIAKLLIEKGVDFVFPKEYHLLKLSLEKGCDINKKVDGISY